jgi:hypothetical protein
MLIGLIALGAINRPELPLASHAPLQLTLYFLGAPLLKWVGAPGCDRRKDDQERKQKGPHLLIVGSE